MNQMLTHEECRTELLLRRFLDESGTGIVPASAFRPTKNDVDGISVSLERLPNPIDRVLADTRRPKTDYGVCQFNLIGLPELSIALSPTAADEGHATIPQMAPPYDELAKGHTRRIQLRDWQDELRRRAVVIHTPVGEVE
jgi:hypothetical protein